MIKYLKKYRLYANFFETSIYLKLFRKKYISQFLPFSQRFVDKTGIEIGGPSALLSSDFMPVYQLARQIDGCNYSNHTVWEGKIESDIYHYHTGKKGKQIISEGSVLNGIPDNQYDFVVSCHNLEHFANPLKALYEWHRILKKGGTMVLILPDKRYTFDRKRPYTSFSHIKKDHEMSMDENDLTHVNEVIAHHDLQLDPGAGADRPAFESRCRNNIENRCLHHHVFSDKLLKEMFSELHIQVNRQYYIPDINKVIIGTKR